MKTLFTALAALAFLAVLPVSAQAGPSCSQKVSNLNIDDKSYPLAGSIYGKDVSLTSEDCVQQDINEAANQAAALGAIVEFYPDGDGFHANVVAANGDLNSDATAVGFNLMYTHDLPEGPFNSLRVGGSAGSLVNGDDQIYALTLGVNWGGSRGSRAK